MSVPVLQIESLGLGMTIQDRGRVGWRRFGVPSSGSMDDHAAMWANRLLDNPATAAMVELLLQGGTLRVLENVWVAVTGADCECNLTSWRAVHLRKGEVLHFAHNVNGLWAYVAVEGGFESETVLGSRSTYTRAKLGRTLAAGDILARRTQHSFNLPAGVAGRVVPWSETRNYTAPPILCVWPGPQWDLFSSGDREQFFGAEWTLSSQSDRVGYRLSGAALRPLENSIRSEPVRVGSIQVPESGEPIVTMRDGPTVGGYPKLGVLESTAISWLAQCRPGQTVRFQFAQ
jgi:biotin-dependent carboxylase-like uncharacterized protein